MGNPCRYLFDNRILIRRPEIDEETRNVRIIAPEADSFSDHYDEMVIDMTNNQSDFNPNWASPPGDTIQSILEEREITSLELAQLLGEPPEVVESLLNGTYCISEKMAEKLSEALGASKKFWMARENTYRKDLARISERTNSG